MEKSDGKEEVLEGVDSEDGAEIHDGILDVENEDSNMTEKNRIEHDTTATWALDVDEILDMTNIVNIEKDSSLKDFSGRIDSERLSPRSLFVEVNIILEKIIITSFMLSEIKDERVSVDRLS
ncbi:hypothetical protein JTB14_013848 [Gonioctena quinquepunctata]|nr:hypothetical protein JTB14_013848 [Gonioctena quinquepunctata]